VQFRICPIEQKIINILPAGTADLLIAPPSPPGQRSTGQSHLNGLESKKTGIFCPETAKRAKNQRFFGGMPSEHRKKQKIINILPAGTADLRNAPRSPPAQPPFPAED